MIYDLLLLLFIIDVLCIYGWEGTNAMLIEIILSFLIVVVTRNITTIEGYLFVIDNKFILLDIYNTRLATRCILFHQS